MMIWNYTVKEKGVRMARSTVNTLAADIEKILDKYADDCSSLTKEVVKKVAQKGAQALKSESQSKFKGDKYWKGWGVKAEDNRLGATATIYNRTVPGLPHLLEHGHAKRGGGRVAGRIHIYPVEQEIIESVDTEFSMKL